MRQIQWTRNLLTEFLRNNPHQHVRIEDRATRAFLEGTIPAVFDMDLCSSILAEAELKLSLNGWDISLTFHEDFLGVHILLLTPDSCCTVLSLPWEIPYERLQLELLTGVSAPNTTLSM